ncbi:peptidase S41 [Bacteroidia bacterium]|nr:peptidase S41 [Bacteroidia bacterium]
MNSRTKILLPLIIAVSLCVGVFIGNIFTFVATHPVTTISKPKGSYNKINALLDLIDRDYVDTVDMRVLMEDAIPDILAQLDPHSVYIPASDLQSVNEGMEGSFSGIGVQFNIQNDTVMIVAVIPNGPSEKLGIQAGDRIVTVADTAFVGEKITNEGVMKTLRGKKGTQVKVGIKRNGVKDIIPYTITRGDIPINSVDIAYMITPRTGYIKINMFSARTYDEFMAAIGKLQADGAEQLIIDLRGNPGGAMDIAIAMINELLPKNSLIVYTEGKTMPRENFRADGSGTCKKMKVAVLIDEWSASASEIFAGAIQDNDRGAIIGRRSFGKGLVQTQIAFPDSSALRLTIARYYTPSGRSIQKHYDKGDDADYENDIANRYLHGEFDVKDSIKQADTVQYRTRKGRVVYGGGGIMPDYFVPRDTLGQSAYFNKLVNYSYIYQFAFDYADRNRQILKEYRTWQELIAYLRTQNLVNEVAQYAESKGVKKNIVGLRKSEKQIENLTFAYISRLVLGDEAFYPILNERDKTVLKALEVLK